MALGRGLGELLGEIEIAYENSNKKNESVSTIEIDLIDPNPFQPRKIFNEEKLKELSESIIEHGLLQPIVITKNEDRYYLVAGERRLRASKLAQLETIQAIVINIDNTKLRELALIENIQRDDLNIIEVAYSYAGLLNDYGITHEQLAKIVSKSRSSISNTLRLLTLSAYAQKMLGTNKITKGHAKVIVGLSEEEQKIVVDSIIGQRLSVRETEQLIKTFKEEQKTEKEQTPSKKSLNIDSLKDLSKKLTTEKLQIKVDQNYFKIKLNSQEDIETILKYFSV
ncbi:MAG: ParB/RepB/Spo0J family partition protein [Campylobacterales bacterium]|nr:ParB/RepB/Spo0J family partition protein [Campylobacterales bacterium]